ncbi:MAG: L,D-transpeptidase family protein, partial [Pseudomonadota bacterium]
MKRSGATGKRHDGCQEARGGSRVSDTRSMAIDRRKALALLGGAALAGGLPHHALASSQPVPETGLATETPVPVQVFVSLSAQRADVYRGDELIESSSVSTGKRGHSTPAGVFSVLEKRRRHFSNLYNNAPMPYMQRLTWSGIALHQGRLPGYPASHGCVRMPGSFARWLFETTEYGAHVVVTREPQSPRVMRHAGLLQPLSPDAFVQAERSYEIASLMPVALTSASPSPVEAALAMADDEHDRALSALYVRRDAAPLRILVTRVTGREKLRDAQRVLNELGFGA